MKKNIQTLTYILGISFITFMASCSKNDIATPSLDANTLAVTIPAVGDSANFTENNTKGYLKLISTGVYGARNFCQGTVADNVDTTQWSDPADTYFYSLTNNDGADSASGNWDFKFNGTANADFVVNTNKYTVSYINTGFDAVTSTTSVSGTDSDGTISWNTIVLGSLGSGISTSSGWYIYDLANHIMTAYTPRTYKLIPKSSAYKTWKIRINSVYKNGTPNATSSATNYPFMSFDYAAL